MSQSRRQAIKVLIVEDDEEIKEIVSLALEINWPELKLISARLGKTGVELVAGESPDLVILDLGLPDTSGFGVLREIRAFSNVPILILTVRGDEADIVRGLEAGADDYMTKPFRQVELLSRMRALTRRAHPASEEALAYGGLSFDPPTGQLSHGRARTTLTRIEGQVLSHLMKDAGQVSTYSALTEAIWGMGRQEETETLRVYIQRLRQKIEADPEQPQIILASPGIGYSLAKAD